MDLKISLIIFAGLVTYVAGDCWETSSCQLDSWATKGCSQYGRSEQSKRRCYDNGQPGYFYTCCSGGGGGSQPSPGVRTGKTTRYWDCCKPSCSWDGKAPVSSPVKACSKDGVSRVGTNEGNGCNGGNSFVCNDQQPFVIGDTAYGFAAANLGGESEWGWCCGCYELTFTSGPIQNKKMIVQVTNTGGDLGENHFDLQIPGGGVGLFNGCGPQWGAWGDGWGARYGGINSRGDCAQLPKQLQSGCYFRFDWFKNADNPTMSFVKVKCPDVLSSKTGCSRKE